MDPVGGESLPSPIAFAWCTTGRMEISRPFPADSADIRLFRSPEYVEFLSSVSSDALHDHTHSRQLKRFNVGEDCPVFDGLFSFCQASAGGSIGAAVKLNRQFIELILGLLFVVMCHIVSNILGIMLLPNIYTNELRICLGNRVLYVDIDVHHGDGVEEAFYVTDRVMTVSFHKFGEFFPGTGHIKDIGVGTGKYYALNVPLNDGLNDENFRTLLRPIMQKVMEVYQPDAVVLQCGADSLVGDRLGCFNEGACRLSSILETAVAVDVEPDNKLPYNEYFEYFVPDYTLHVEPGNRENLNTDRDLEKIRNMLLDQLSKLQHAPSVPFQSMPPTTEAPEETEGDMEVRPKPRIWNGDAEYESDDDEKEKLHGGV
ncbi:histone deacetylase [Striga asiatica]|uniref:histone deacetylase n=1 Tax=Striga asiatica TaxID=4170 RepID=A0A5A7R674_STRAF|nr:histone deacetylase [Striga asiatica]